MDASSEEAVLLLHGAWMNQWVMAYLAHALRWGGFAAQALTYRTMRDTIEGHLRRVAGCRAAADLAQRACGEFLLGKSIAVWREPVDLSLDPRFEVGVIAGTRALGLGCLVTRLPRPNDGVVCLDETKFPAMRDHLALPLGHTLMLVSPRVARETAAFLRTGAFRR